MSQRRSSLQPADRQDQSRAEEATDVAPRFGGPLAPLAERSGSAGCVRGSATGLEPTPHPPAIRPVATQRRGGARRIAPTDQATSVLAATFSTAGGPVSRTWRCAPERLHRRERRERHSKPRPGFEPRRPADLNLDAFAIDGDNLVDRLSTELDLPPPAPRDNVSGVPSDVPCSHNPRDIALPP